MGRLFAYMANDPDRARCALYAGRKLLATASESGVVPDSWGIGFYQGGEVLLQRRPKPPAAPLDFYAVAEGLRTDAIIGHVRVGTVGKPKNENTHPFRFRSWLFAHHGTLPAWDQMGAALAADVPDFLRRNIRGQTDSEHLFHSILSFLHVAGELDDPSLSTGALIDAVHAALARVGELAGVEAAAAAECALAITNGRILVATRQGRPVHVMQTRAVLDCPVCRESAPSPGRREKRVDHEHLRSVTLVADAPAAAVAPWQEVPDRHFIAVSHNLEVAFTPL
jgi:glutamine amidotransferase